MKKIKIIALSLLLANSFWGCEKDDICTEGTPTTPSVVIEFYDALNPTNLKGVTNLKVIADGMNEGIIFNPNATITEQKYWFNGSKLRLPLKTNAENVIYSFALNSGAANPADSNTDILNFSYTKEDVFISRACGYKTVFQLNENNPVVTDADATFWITDIEVMQSNIQNENETHIKIYF
ncbi:DUF6452 family protein [Flavobacterium saliperosum]|uniref:Ig-like domain-containing protein n=1 Tax=Flavobacterium saliperosum TaxID=329186 RepID=A0A1G4W0V6_9FLAO|nr:DUF6452 family protein [Flavobacterium saliperosum]SCX14995.1 hypothetical protein SAMN02927925_02166 [Flavobacterium saliperosum]